MDCPRCHLTLKQDRYESVNVNLCHQCWGYWLDRGEFTRITTIRELMFSDEEKRAILERARAAAPDDGGTLPCPRCAKEMEKIDFNVKAPITLDRCPAHGIWLDTHELKLAQVLAEEAAAVRNLFFQKLHQS